MGRTASLEILHRAAPRRNVPVTFALDCQFQGGCLVTPVQNEIAKLAAIAGAERATADVCGGLLRLLLPSSAADREGFILLLERQLSDSREQDLAVPIPQFADVEQHYATELYREALEAAHQRLISLLRRP
jgi:hypothetical protein